MAPVSAPTYLHANAWFVRRRVRGRLDSLAYKVPVMTDQDPADLLISAVHRLRLTDATLTAKQVHALLVAEGSDTALSDVKKACSKASKQKPPPAQTVCRPLLVKPSGSVIFFRCLRCQKRVVSNARVCSGCLCVCYCSAACAEADEGHHRECADYARHARRDVRVRLEGDPPWLAAAMEHRCDATYCELLEQMGCHDSIYGLICGCVGPSAEHRYVTDSLPPSPPPSAPSEVLLGGWSSYYAARGLAVESQAALLLSWPLTVAHVLNALGLPERGREGGNEGADGGGGGGEAPGVTVHYLGPEKEVMMLPLFSELAWLFPALRLHIEMVGPLGIALPPPIAFDGEKGGRVTVAVRRGLYHEVAQEMETPDVVVALNAGLAIAGYNERWPETLGYLQRLGAPIVFTDYSAQSIDKGLRFGEQHGGLDAATASPTALNPFRAPMRLPRVDGGAVGFPTLSNGFIGGWGVGRGVVLGEPEEELRK